MPRGRKPNHEKKPSRQLANQRAFRKRRADLIATLEERKEQLEKENAILRGDQSSQENNTSTSQNENAVEVQHCQRCSANSNERIETTRLVEQVLSVHSSLLHSTENLKRVLEEHSIARLQSNSNMVTLSDPGQDEADILSTDGSTFQSDLIGNKARSLEDNLEVPTHSPQSSGLGNRECCLGIPGCVKQNCPFSIPGFIADFT